MDSLFVITFGHTWQQFTNNEIFGLGDYIKQWWTDDQRHQQSTLTDQYEETNPFWEEDNLSDEES